MPVSLVRLRPVVHASPTATGVHVRGWASSFTVTGGKGLWTVWQRVATALADGVPADELGAPAGATPAVSKAVDLILDQLRAHDMLVTVPDWGRDAPADSVRGWLESVAQQPQQAWRRLSTATIAITGSPVLVAAARRAITAVGLRVQTAPGEGLVVTSGNLAVAADCSGAVGFVVHPGSYEDVISDAKAVARRLDIRPQAAPEVLAALVGSAAAHRLLCAVGDLPDPSGEFIVHPTEELPAGPPRLGVLVARLDPLRAAYHPWLRDELPADPAEAMALVADPELGTVAAPETGDLPQVPASLARSGGDLGVGTTAEGARIDAVARAMNSGLDPVHTRGITLRNAVHRLGLAGAELSEEDWNADATARRWWKALILRFGVPAMVEVRQLAPQVVQAEIRSGDRVLAWAIERDPADAVAFAALAATGVVQAGIEVPEPFHLNGAAPLPAPAQTDWVTREWHWPADVRDREEELQTALARLVKS
jgi:hypothetical protein